MTGERKHKSMRKVKSIDRLYEETKDCSLVITNDIALATALNKMVDKPIVGAFAMTPKQIAAASAVETLGRPIWSELRVAMVVAEETNLDFAYVHSQIQYIQTISQFTNDVRKHLFTDDARKVYESYRAIPTMENAMEKFSPEGNRFYSHQGRIAVIGDYNNYQDDDRYGDLPIFNHLEKKFIPNGYKPVSFYEGADEEENEFIPYQIDKIYRIGNDRQLADNAVALIDPEKATDFAIVIKSDSPLADAVRSALYRNGIPFVNSLTVKDLNQVRDYISFITLAMSFETIRVGDIRELFMSLGYPINRKLDEHLVCKETFSGEAEEFRNVMKDIRDYTFEDIRDKVFSKRKNLSTTVKILIDDLRITDKLITAPLLSKITYAVDNVKDLHHNEQIPESEKRGVLLADCGNSMFIDRPVVIYLGMEQDWNVDFSDKKYIDDVEYENLRAAVRLEVLLQQGERRFYLVNTSKKGEEAKPCQLFDDIFSKSIESFSDICDNVVSDAWANGDIPKIIRGRETVGKPQKLDHRLSQSTLKEYLKCPYTMTFHENVTTEDKEYFQLGNIVHDFAELYVSHKDIVDEKGIEFFIDVACEKFSGISTPMMEELDRDKIGRLMTAVKRYIDSIGIQNVKLDKPVDPKKHLFFSAVEPAITVSTSMCESDIPSDDHRIHGKMDFFYGRGIYDYKTGKPKNSKKIAKCLDYRTPFKETDVQALVYLAVAQEKDMGSEFNLFFAMDNDTESADSDFDITRNVRKVRIVDLNDQDYFTSKEVKEYFSSSGKGSKSGYQTDPEKREELISTILGAVDGPMDTWADKIEDIKTAFSVIKNTKDKSKIKTFGNAATLYIECATKGYAATDREVIVRKQFLDEFVAKMDEEYPKIQNQSITEFDAEPKIDCRDCYYREFCTKEKNIVSEEEADE